MSSSRSGRSIPLVVAMRPPVKQPQGLIDVLLDKRPENYDRDDAALDLGAYDEPDAEEALFQVATDPATDDDLADRCGESLANIWCRKQSFNLERAKCLKGPAFRSLRHTLEALCPELVSHW